MAVPIPTDPFTAAFTAFAPGINAAAAGGIFSDRDQLASGGGSNSLGDNWTVSTGGGTATATNSKGEPARLPALTLPGLPGLPPSVGGISTTLIAVGLLALFILKKRKK